MLPEGSSPIEEEFHVRFGIMELLQVSHIPAALEGEVEPGTRPLVPGSECLSCGQPVEGEVDFHRVERVRIHVEPLTLGHVRRVEELFPVFVDPAGCADPGLAPPCRTHVNSMLVTQRPPSRLASK